MQAIDLAKSIINSKILELMTLNGNQEVIDGLQFVINKLDELKTNLKTSHILLKAQGSMKISITDIDTIIHKDGRVIAGLEQKYRRDAFYQKYVPINASQYITLLDIKRKLGLNKFYYFYHLPKGRYILLPISNGWKIQKLGEGHTRTSYALAPIEEAKNMGEREVVQFFKDLLRGW
jgi:hypothetical protein